MRKGQVVNIDWTVGLGLFLITALTAVFFLTNADIGPDRVNTLEAKTLEIQENLVEETSIKGRKIPLIVRGPENISNIPVDRYYNFSSNAHLKSGGGDLAVELDILESNVVAVTDSGNLTRSMVYFTESVSNASYNNDIETNSDWINNSKISIRKDSSGINSLKISGQELLNPNADLGTGDSSINESGIYAETLSGHLRAYNNSSEFIIDDRTGNMTFNLKNLSTVYWYENDTAISLTGTGVKAEGNTKGFSIASDYGITFIGDMTATVSKPDNSTVKAEIDAEKVRVRLHDSDYNTGKERIKFYDKGYIVLGASKKFSAPYKSKISELNSASQRGFENSLNIEGFGYNIGFGSWLQKLVDQISDWNQEGEFNATSASRKDNSGDLGLGYRNGTQGDSLVGYWRTDRTSSGSGGNVIDYSGEGNDGTTKNGVTTGSQGTFGTNSFDFDGTDDWVSIPSGVHPTNDNDWTVSFWVKVDSNETGSGRQGWAYWKDEDESSQEDSLVGIGVYSGDWELAFWGNDHKHTGAVDFDNWQHFTATYDSSVSSGNDDMFVYLNGSLSSSQEAGPLSLNNDVIDLMARDQGSKGFLTGSLDEVRVYNRSLSQSEVKRLYFYGRDGKFEGDYTVENQTGSFQKWNKLTVDAVIPTGTSLEAVFESLDNNGNAVDKHTIQIKDGENSYSLGSDSSVGYRIKFVGNSNNPEKSWEVKDYSLKYGPELKHGIITPLDTSAVVSERSSALVRRNGTFSKIQNRVIIWP